MDGWNELLKFKFNFIFELYHKISNSLRDLDAFFYPQDISRSLLSDKTQSLVSIVAGVGSSDAEGYVDALKCPYIARGNNK